ncbi:hypothetical protein [Mammaliicoccus sciuri]|uniref:hypothetical protein n=1 Tax=Mammaliicoccus sciuri TaxID=1296 RepID=UPI0021D096E7|nr:hypothetical protein [Mammaliicoccus sciuri]UXV31789.1 hypothetical protein MUA60_12700 [Mammaliicoccus sciuri]
MLYDSNLKIYQPLNIQSDFNMGLLLLFVIEGSSKIYINGKKKFIKQMILLSLMIWNIIVFIPMKILL